MMGCAGLVLRVNKMALMGWKGKKVAEFVKFWAQGGERDEGGPIWTFMLWDRGS